MNADPIYKPGSGPKGAHGRVTPGFTSTSRFNSHLKASYCSPPEDNVLDRFGVFRRGEHTTVGAVLGADLAFHVASFRPSFSAVLRPVNSLHKSTANRLANATIAFFLALLVPGRSLVKSHLYFASAW